MNASNTDRVISVQLSAMMLLFSSLFWWTASDHFDCEWILRLSGFQLADILYSIYGHEANMFVTCNLSKPQLLCAVQCFLAILSVVLESLCCADCAYVLSQTTYWHRFILMFDRSLILQSESAMWFLLRCSWRYYAFEYNFADDSFADPIQACSSRMGEGRITSIKSLEEGGGSRGRIWYWNSVHRVWCTSN